MPIKVKQAYIEGVQSATFDILDGKIPAEALPSLKTINYESIIGEGNIEVGGGGGEPAKYIKEAEVNGDVLKLTKKNNTVVQFDVSGKANQQDLDTEKNYRVQGDESLGQLITDEANARESADTNLQSAINQEGITREQADTTLQNNINLKADQSALSTEVSQRQSQYSQLDTRINGKQDKLTAGTNITIDENNVISATASGSNIESITVGGEKLTPFEKDIKIVLGNSLAYSDQEPGLAYKNLHVNFKSTHGLEVDGTNGLKVKINQTSGTLALDANGLKVADNKFVLLPNEPVAGQGLNVPYYFDVLYSLDKVTVKDYTVDLLNKNKEPQQFSLDINCATQSTAGLLSASDKKNIDEMLPPYPTDTESEYVLGIKYVDGAWVKYWKETVNKSDIVDKGMVDYMVIKQ